MGSDIAILATGSIVTEAIEAANILKQKGINASVFSCPVIKPRADKAIKDIIANFDAIITLEEHTVVGGFGSSVAEVVAESGKGIAFKSIGIQDEYAEFVGDRSHLRKEYKMDALSVAKVAIKLLK